MKLELSRWLICIPRVYMTLCVLMNIKYYCKIPILFHAVLIFIILTHKLFNKGKHCIAHCKLY